MRDALSDAKQMRKWADGLYAAEGAHKIAGVSRMGVMLMGRSLEGRFHEAMINIYVEAQRECKYPAYRFRRMVSDIGGLEAAKRLLRSRRDVQHGFTELLLCGRLDLTVEAHVLQDKFIDLFEDDDCRKAERRLLDHDPDFFRGRENRYSAWLSNKK